jgi:hypothetical protein
MPSNETSKYAIYFGIGFIILAIIMFFAVYNTVDHKFLENYFGGFVCSISFGILGIVFTGTGLYFLDRKTINSSKT